MSLSIQRVGMARKCRKLLRKDGEGATELIMRFHEIEAHDDSNSFRACGERLLLIAVHRREERIGVNFGFARRVAVDLL